MMNIPRMEKLGLLALIGLLAVGCGKVSSAQKKAAAALLSGTLSGSAKDTSRLAGLQEFNYETPNRLPAKIHDALQGVLWLARFQLDGVRRVGPGNADALTLDANTCSQMGSAGISGCTMACNSAQTGITTSCSIPDGSDETCDGVKYTFKSTSFSLGMDFANINASGTNGSATIDFNFASNITGGELDGKKLECALKFSVDIAGAKAGTAEYEPSCNDFSCKWDGADISCDDLKADMKGTHSCS